MKILQDSQTFSKNLGDSSDILKISPTLSEFLDESHKTGFTDGLRYFNVYKDNKEGACDLTGKEIISPIYESLIYFSNGFEYKNSEGKWIALGWMLDSEGNGIRGTKEEITNNGVKYYIVSRDGFYGLTDANGKEIVPMKMDKIELAGGNRLKYKANDSWGMMNFLGKILIPTSRGYTSIGEFKTSNKRFPYTMNGYKGECDINGRQVSKIKVSNPSSTKTISSINSSTYSDAKLLGFKGKVKSCRIGQAYWLANCISFNDYVFEMRFSPDGVFSFKANSGYDALIKRDSNNRIQVSQVPNLLVLNDKFQRND